MNDNINVSGIIKVDNLDEIELKVRELNAALEKASSIIKELAAYDNLRTLLEI